MSLRKTGSSKLIKVNSERYFFAFVILPFQIAEVLHALCKNSDHIDAPILHYPGFDQEDS